MASMSMKLLLPNGPGIQLRRQSIEAAVAKRAAAILTSLRRLLQCLLGGSLFPRADRRPCMSPQSLNSIIVRDRKVR